MLFKTRFYELPWRRQRRGTSGELSFQDQIYLIAKGQDCPVKLGMFTTHTVTFELVVWALFTKRQKIGLSRVTLITLKNSTYD